MSDVRTVVPGVSIFTPEVIDYLLKTEWGKAIRKNERHSNWLPVGMWISNNPNKLMVYPLCIEVPLRYDGNSIPVRAAIVPFGEEHPIIPADALCNLYTTYHFPQATYCSSRISSNFF